MAITALPTPPSRSAPSTFSTLADAFLGALPVFATEANATAAAMNLNDTTATSVTSLLIEVASKSLTVDVSKSYQPGMSVKIARTSSPSNWMHGDVTTYNAGTGALVVNVTSILGSGTFTDWTITFSAPSTPIVYASAAEILAGTEAAKAIAPDQLKAAGFRARVNKTQADSPYTVVAANLTGLSVFTNTGATGQIINQLPAGADGYTFKGIVTAAQYMQFLCNGTEKIRFQGTQTAAGGYVRSNVVGNVIEAEWSGTEWVITGMGGAWSYDE